MSEDVSDKADIQRVQNVMRRIDNIDKIVNTAERFVPVMYQAGKDVDKKEIVKQSLLLSTEFHEFTQKFRSCGMMESLNDEFCDELSDG